MTSILKQFLSKGYQAYYIGGYVRDYLLGKSSSDIDVTTNASVADMIELFKSFPVDLKGKNFGCVAVYYQAQWIQCTTFRRDSSYLNHRHPQTVEFVKTLSEDVLRRDFTINALAMDDKGRIYDFIGGIQDLNQRIIKTVIDPQYSFQQDALRMLRALRFMSQLSFDLERKTHDALIENFYLVDGLSEKQKRAEIEKILLGDFVDLVFQHYYACFHLSYPLKLSHLEYNIESRLNYLLEAQHDKT